MIVALSHIYIFIYTIILCLIFLINILYNTFYFLKNYHITKYVYYIKKYTKSFKVLSICIIIFSGLPPTVVFLLKLNIIFNIIKYTHQINIVILFLCFLISMFYYFQFFIFKNNKVKFKDKELKQIPLNLNLNFYAMYFINITLIIFFFSIFFYIDLIIFLL